MTTTSTSAWALFKNCSYLMVFICSTAYLGITPDSVIILTVFVVLDVVLGILKSALLYGGSSIKSSILERGVIAKCLILLIPILIALAGKGIDINLGDFAQGVITVLIFSELYSILGNLYAIRTGREKQEFDAVAYVIAGLKNLLKKAIIDDDV